MSVALSLSQEFDGLIAALEQARLDYALVGGLAVAVWGAPRATKDIDLLVPKDAVEAIKAVARSRGFVLEAGPMTFRDGMELRRVTTFEGSQLLTLDQILVNDDVADAWRSRQRVTTERGELWVVAREALNRHEAARRASTRPLRHRTTEGSRPMTVSMTPADITRRLVEASDASDLSADRRLEGKLDLSPRGITQRLREASELLDLCVSLRAREPGVTPTGE